MVKNPRKRLWLFFCGWGFVLGFGLGFGSPVWATNPKDTKDTKVVYFGGHAASPAQMSCWAEGARNSSYGKSGVEFTAIAYPIASPSPSQAAASAAGQASIQRIVSEIDNGPKDRVYVIAGHSSGASLANRVAELVKNPKQVKLVILDGSRPSASAQQRTRSTTCYVPRGTVAFNGASMASCGVTKSIDASDCKGNRTCGHFALVNRQTLAGLTSYRSDGYRRRDGRPGCSPELSWIGDLRSSEPPRIDRQAAVMPAGSDLDAVR